MLVFILILYRHLGHISGVVVVCILVTIEPMLNKESCRGHNLAIGKGYVNATEAMESKVW